MTVSEAEVFSGSLDAVAKIFPSIEYVDEKPEKYRSDVEGMKLIRPPV